MIRSINPYNNQVVNSFEWHSSEEIEKRLSKAHLAYKSWKEVSIEERIALLFNVAQLLRDRKEELARLITLEMGKLIVQSQSEIEMCASVYEYYAKNAQKFLQDKPIEIPDGKAFVRYAPIGIVLAVEPWNFPFNQVARLAAPNIVVGNVIALKHASLVPGCAHAIEQIFKAAGAPEGVFTNFFIPGGRVSELAKDNRIQGLSLTGSEGAGASLAEAAGKNLKKSVLELGGSDAFIVLDDADIDLAVEKAIKGRFANMGQACTSAKRIILLESIAQEFTDKFIAQLQHLKTGDPLDPETQVGPLSSEEAAKQVDQQVREAVQAGAKVLLGAERSKREGAFYPFTVLTGITKDMAAYHQEIFGPVAMLYTVATEHEAITLANDVDFGLGGAVFSKNRERAVSVADRMETGMIFINENVASRPDLPFGGVKRSGYGRELGSYGIEEFVNKKLIRIKE